MLRTVSAPFDFSLSRAGGSLITARIDVWLPSDEGWKPVTSCVFSDSTVPKEVRSLELAPNTYTCVFQCFVEESLNGRYEFQFSVNEAATYSDSGDVNTTSANNDSKVYKDQFVLVVRPGERPL